MSDQQEQTKLANSLSLSLMQRYICSRFARAIAPGSMDAEQPDFEAIRAAVDAGHKAPASAKALQGKTENQSPPEKREIGGQAFERAWSLKHRLRPETVMAMIGYAPGQLGFLRRLSRLEALHLDDFKETDYFALLFLSLRLLETASDKRDTALLNRILEVPRLRWAPRGEIIVLPRLDAPFNAEDARAIAKKRPLSEHDRANLLRGMQAGVEPLELKIRPSIIDNLPQGDPMQDLRYMLSLLTENGELAPGAALRWAIDFATCVVCNQTLLVDRLRSNLPIPPERARFVLHCAEILFDEPTTPIPGIAFSLCGISLPAKSIEEEVRANALQMNLALARNHFKRAFGELGFEPTATLEMWDRSLVGAPSFMRRESTEARNRMWKWWRNSRLGRALSKLANARKSHGPYPSGRGQSLFRSGVRVLSSLRVARMVNLQSFRSVVSEVQRESQTVAMKRRANGELLTYDDLYRLAEHRREILRRNGLLK
jgi:hypothetical protein